MMWFREWLDRRAARHAEMIDLAHRWDALAEYNTLRSKGVVFEPLVMAKMRHEQKAFDSETIQARTQRHKAARAIR